LTTHSLIHTIQVGDYDDGIPDFLVDDIIDPDAIPDTIYTSDGRVITQVRTVTNVSITGTEATDITIQFLPPTTGWFYLVIDDPAATTYVLESVIRSDLKNITLGYNAWRTQRVKYVFVIVKIF
jgi:hypothetical protein